MIDEKMIERITAEVIRQMTAHQTVSESTEKSYGMKAQNGVLPDLTTKEMKDQITLDRMENPEMMRQMKEKTPARIGIGNAGARLKTQTYLTLRADHAGARDAVFRDVNPELVQEMGLFSIESMCTSRNEHLTRPDLGRKLSDDTKKELKSKCQLNPTVQIYVSDGLSSQAVEANIADILPSLMDGLQGLGIGTGTPFYMRYGRVPAMDVVSETLGAEVTCVLIGERPGLATANSMSAYIAYKATVGMPESRRTVVSNIHSGGIPAAEAGAHIAQVIKTMLERKQSGVDLQL
ncbi:Ethanolamine ammonia-lyase light chain [uncultured Roseburia sp.]|uniref:Ethanolamine ammonia-lyase small subunit n=1 Tax=Brotonthovivens ammoniilytica TaxID=2981725 RepID=A0ABT2TF24_9FIRM|nr:ethanolamine ammonia-lyase subunit EutC [Brotonthovivens ammoniilytica]MCU6760788.1 ethanolamine ammonia-lyase subunit EutC [Brotonthovivens ammoniilytica]SCI09300.1 Ethanolamine ammonia-lyase light chain [uncultured Roseburia sp.]